MTAVFTHLANLATPVLIPRPGIFVAPATVGASISTASKPAGKQRG